MWLGYSKKLNYFLDETGSLGGPSIYKFSIYALVTRTEKIGQN
jgi:hypothetical protein